MCIYSDFVNILFVYMDIKNGVNYRTENPVIKTNILTINHTLL